MFLLPEGQYGVYQTNNEQEVFVCSAPSALSACCCFGTTNQLEMLICADMSYQNMSPVRGRPTKLGDITGVLLPALVSCLCAHCSRARRAGMDLMGCAVKAPLAKYDVVYVLPLLTIKMTKVTDLPSSRSCLC